MRQNIEVIALVTSALIGAAVLSGSAVFAAGVTDEEHEMVRDGDVVQEWRNPKLIELKQLPELAAASKTGEEQPILIFKHSTTCPISGRAAQRVDAMLTESEEPLPQFFMVKVIESRPVSITIEELYGVKHESPQVLLIKDGEAVWNTSHDDITAEALLTAIEENDARPKVKESDQ